MAYKLPADIEQMLQKQYKDVPIPAVIDSIFSLIVHKVTNDSSCTVREFGKFIAFVTHSEKLGKESVRFKFKLSAALRSKMKKDEFLLNNLPVKAQTSFTEDHANRVKDKQGRKQANLDAASKASKITKTKTDERIVADHIRDIVHKS
jgi:hypothetical protein